MSSLGNRHVDHCFANGCFRRITLATLLVVAGPTVGAEPGKTQPARTQPARVVQNSIGMELSSLPGQPAARLKPFAIGTREVTQAEYERVMGQNPSTFSARGGLIPAGTDAARLPVENVTWEEAADFCRRLSQLPEEKSAGRRYRLPREAEWEYACSAGAKTNWFFGDQPFRCDVSGEPVSELLRQQLQLKPLEGVVVTAITPGSLAAKNLQVGDIILRLNGEPVGSESQGMSILRQSRGKAIELEYIRSGQRRTIRTDVPTGPDLDQYAWYAMNADNHTHDVGQKQPNSFGLYDVYGNVEEWCWDAASPLRLTGANILASKLDKQGEQSSTDALRRHLDLPDGFAVAALKPDSIAARVFKVNDIILIPEGSNVVSFDDLLAVYEQKMNQEEAKNLEFAVLRDGKRQTVSVAMQDVIPANRERVLRGGSYNSLPPYAQSSSRGSAGASEKFGSVGFRVAMDVRDK